MTATRGGAPTAPERGRRPESWTRAALEPPRAHGVPLDGAIFKSAPEDFHVEERLSFRPSDDGPHRLLRVEKRAANTRWVASELARIAGVPPAEVGFAGLKDRQAVAIQWFSVPAGGVEWREVRAPEFRVLEVRANARKLKRGALSGNEFRIRLHDVRWPREALEAKLDALRRHGVPNYFGPQRFGRNGYNLDRAATWVQRQSPPRGRAERGFALSAARSLVFNALLGRRVDAGDWSQLAPGDLANLDGSASYFAVAAVDEAMHRRAFEFDIHPSGPLWGRGDPQSGGRALEHEMAIGREFSALTGLLASQGLAHERRALRCAVRNLDTRQDGGTLILSFSLGRGQFATSVLRELCGIDPAAELDADEE